jgi:FkbM family methyltransferase
MNDHIPPAGRERIVHEFPPFNRQKVCRYGEMLFNRNDKYIGRSLEWYGEYSEGEVEVFRQSISPASAVVEVGANIGAHTVFLARHVGPQGRVWALEPQRIAFQTLCANVAINQLTNVYCSMQAAGACSGTIRVPQLDPTHMENFGGLSLGQYQHGDEVPLVTLDSLGLARCEFLKIDAEGMEKQVLEGAVELISRTQPILYVENDYEDRSDELIRFIDSLGYAMYWHHPPYFNPANFAANSENMFPNEASINMLCVSNRLPHRLTGFRGVTVPPAG